MTIVSEAEVKARLGQLIERARRGEEILIARDGEEPVACIIPVKRVRIRAKSKQNESENVDERKK